MPGKCLSQGSASSGASATAGKCRFRCRCGKERRTGVPREAPPAVVGQFRGFRNGRKMRDSLPLWQGAEDQSAPGCTSRRGRPIPGLPQRQENTGSAAVVDWGGGPRWPGKHLPQWSASSGASATAGKCRFRCRCGKERRTRVPQRAEDRGNMERRHFMFIPPEGLLRAASPKPSIRRRAQPEYSSGTQQPPRQQ